MNDIFDADDVMFSEGFLDDAIVGEGDSGPGTGAADLAEATLVDQFLHALQVGVSVGDVRLDALKHANGGVVELDEDAVLDLAQTQKTQDLLFFRGHGVDTTDTDDKGYLGAFRYEEFALFARVTLGFDERTLVALVLRGIGLGTLEDFLLAIALLLIGRLEGYGAFSRYLFLRAALFQDRFGNSRSA